jgi:hypothetical protein
LYFGKDRTQIIQIIQLFNNKMTYNCLYCTRTFSTPYALKRHVSDKHQYTEEDEGEASRQYEEEPGLWDDDLPIDRSDLWDDDLPTEDPMVKITITIVLKIKLVIIGFLTLQNEEVKTEPIILEQTAGAQNL